MTFASGSPVLRSAGGRSRPRSSAWAALLCLALFAALSAPRPAAAQGGGPISKALRNESPAGGAGASPESAPLTLEEQIARTKERLRTVEAELARAERAGDGAAAQLSAKPEELEERRRLLGDLSRNITARITSLERMEEVAARRAQLSLEVEGWKDFPEKPPYTIEFVDRIRQEILTTSLVLDSLEAEKLRDEASRDLWQERLKKAEPEVRRLTEELEREKDQGKANRLEWLLDLAKLRARAASGGLAAANTSLEDISQRFEMRTAELAFLRRKLEAARSQSAFTEKELDASLSRITKSREKIQADLAATVKRQSRIDEELAELRASLEKLREARDAGRAGPGAGTRITRLEQSLETREVEFVTASIMAESFKTFLTGVNAEERIWKDRYAISQGADPATLTEVHQRNETGFKQLALWENFFISRLQLALSDIASQKQRLAEWKPADGNRALAEAVLGFYEERLETLRQGLSKVNEVKTLLNIWQAEIEERRESVPLGERAVSLLKAAGGFARNIWEFELFTLEDTIVIEGEEMKGERPVTVAKVLQALLILGLGIWVSRLLARAVHKVATSRFRAEENVAALLDKALYIVLLVSVVLIAISFVQIPLTAFAFAGGALAIGAGFGAQNLINNFISGIILLLERPIKLGDIVDVEGIRGRVVNIGARSSTVKRFDGIDILIPNSSFLEKNVTNWTRSDPFLRFTVTVGVAYGSPTRRVQEILEHLVQNDPKVLKYPEPRVVFEDFGDSALIFTAYFWMAIQAEADYRILASEMRHQIDDLFRKEGITIAFPQRDVHLDSLSPVQVEIVEGAAARGAGAPKGGEGGG